MNRPVPEGFDLWGFLSKATLVGMYLASMAISFLWFARVMPDLLIPETSVYARFGPVVSGMVGIIFMEAAAVSWNHMLKATKLTAGQTFVTYFGLGTATGMSIMTTFAAVMLYVGSGTSEIADRVVVWATQDGVALYIALQLLFVFLFLVVFGESGERNRVALPWSKKSNQQPRSRALPQAQAPAQARQPASNQQAQRSGNQGNGNAARNAESR